LSEHTSEHTKMPGRIKAEVPEPVLDMEASVFDLDYTGVKNGDKDIEQLLKNRKGSLKDAER
jgi:hypothetical protein